MKIELPNDLREEVQRVKAALIASQARARLAPFPSGHLAESAATLGKVMDFYLAAVERCYAETNAEFYRDWPLAMEAARNTPAYRAVLGMRITAHRKITEEATVGNIQQFCETFEKALGGLVNLNDAPPIKPTTPAPTK